VPKRGNDGVTIALWPGMNKTQRHDPSTGEARRIVDPAVCDAVLIVMGVDAPRC